MTTSPNPLAGLFSGAQQQALPLQPGAGPVVPGGTPTPDPTAAAQQALGMSKEQMALLNQALQQAATPRFGGGQQPAVPGQQQPMSPTPPSYMTDRPYASTWGPERFMYGVQSAISHLSAAKQERDVRKAENLYTNTLTAAQKYMKPDGTFDANAAAQDPFLSTLKDSDYKKMADTLQESWLNPKSTTPHKEGLKQAQQKFAAQQQQRGRLDKFVQGLIHKATAPLRGGPQLTPEQQQAQTTQILGRAPLGTAQVDPNLALNVAKATDAQRYQEADLALRREQQKATTEHEKEDLALKRDQLKATVQEHSDALQEHYDSLSAQIQARRDALAEKTLDDQARIQNSQQLMDLRRDGQDIQRQMLELRLSQSKGDEPKDREKNFQDAMNSLKGSQTDARLDMQLEDKGWFNYGQRNIAKQNYQDITSRVNAMQKLRPWYVSGKITPFQFGDILGAQKIEFGKDPKTGEINAIRLDGGEVISLNGAAK